MELHDVAEIAQILGSLALVISVFLLIQELRTNNRLVRAANTQALVNLSSPIHLAIIQDRKMAEFLANGAASFRDMDEVDRYRYKTLLIWWLIFHENVFHQWRNGLLANHSFLAWASDLKQFVIQQKLWLQWEEIKEPFEHDFAIHVERLIAECKAEFDVLDHPKAIASVRQQGGPEAAA